MTLLIAVIYMAFISMGLPDALLGSAWPSVYTQLNIPISYAGFVTMLITSGTVISSLLSDRLIIKFGTWAVTVGCTLLTAVALFGFSVSSSLIQLCLWALPYGLGAGSIDAALNNYVALKYKSRQMSWIHFFWGVGATTGPFIMGAALTGGAAWTSGYRFVGVIQIVMTALLACSLPLWKKNDLRRESRAEKLGHLSKTQAVKLPGAAAVLVALFCYSAVETTAGLWASSFMTITKGVSPEEAARWASIFYLGITLGRFAGGFAADGIGDKNMVRAGQISIIAGILVMLIPLGNVMCFIGLILIGLGCAPVFPCLLHETPANFGEKNTQTIMGLQMACAYTGSALMPPLFGIIAQNAIYLYPAYLMINAVIMLVATERLNRRV